MSDNDQNDMYNNGPEQEAEGSAGHNGEYKQEDGSDSQGDQQQESGESLEPEQLRKLFIGGLAHTTDDDMLKEFYSQWGDIVDCVVMVDGGTKRSRGFGFVTYAKSSQLDAAMASRPHTIDGRTVEPKRAIPRDKSAKSDGSNVSVKKLYVSGVREDHTEDMFRQYFSDYGKIIDVEVIVDKNTGKKRGFAFVTFDDYDAVDKCVLERSHIIDGKRCDVKKALSREEMQRSQQKDRDRGIRDGRTRGGFGGARGGGRGNWGGPGGGWGGGYGGPGGGWGGGGWQGGWGEGYGAGYGGGGAGGGSWGPGGAWNPGPAGGAPGGWGGQQGGWGGGPQGWSQDGGWGGGPQSYGRRF